MPENKNEKIKLSLGLAREVTEFLKKKKLWDNSRAMMDGYTKEELAMVKSITLDSPQTGACRDLKFLPNLTTLTINNSFNHKSEVKNLVSLTDKDMEDIYQCKNLECLTIRNQAEITEIQLEKLPKLQVVDICNNAQLDSLTGINKLPDLSILTCYGNDALKDIPNLCDAIKKYDFSDLNLDLMLFPNAIGYNPLIGTHDKDAVAKLNSYRDDYLDVVKWTQNFHTIDDPQHPWKTKNIVINQYQMVQLHNKACQILDQNVQPHAGTRDTIIAIEKYLADNVIYDDDSIKDGNEHTHYVPFHNGVSTINGPLHGANGAFNCLMFGTSVCQGYSRGEQYLLALKGIQSTAVSCVGTRDTIGISDGKKVWDNVYEAAAARRDARANHSIIRIDDYYNLYSDPTWNASRAKKRGDKSLPFSLRTKEEISQTHTLLRFDRHVSNNHLKESRQSITDSIKSNDLFLKAKSAEVEAQHKQLGQKQAPVRGMILTGRN